MLLAKLLQRPLHQFLGKAFTADHAHSAGVQAAQGFNLGQHVVLVGQMLAVVVQQQQPRCRGHHAAAVTLEQHQPQLFFQQCNLAADGTMPSFSAAWRTLPEVTASYK